MYKKAYHRAYNINKFKQELVDGLYNFHMRDYMQIHLHECQTENHILALISQAIVLIHRKVDKGDLPKAEGHGVEFSKDSYRDRKNARRADMEGQDYRMMRINNVESRDDKDRCYNCNKVGYYAQDCRQRDPVNAVGERKSCHSQTDMKSDSDTEPDCATNDPGVMFVLESGTAGWSRSSQRESSRYYRRSRSRGFWSCSSHRCIYFSQDRRICHRSGGQSSASQGDIGL